MTATLELLSRTAAAAPAPAAPIPRVDLYTPIHKALRLYMTDTLTCIGAMDAGDADDLRAGTDQLASLLALLRSHLAHENDFVHVALEARHAGSSRRIASEHAEHLAAIDALADEATALAAAPAAQRPVLALRLYRHLALFVADNLQHMHVEETAHNRRLWADYGDAELLAVHAELLASVPPPEMALVLHWMAPALSHAELAGMLAAMQCEMPPQHFAAVLDQVQPRLSTSRWDKLARALQVPQQRGLVDAGDHGLCDR